MPSVTQTIHPFTFKETEMAIQKGGRYRFGDGTPNRDGRDRLIEATQDGYLDAQMVVEMCAKWMTSDEIYDMCDVNEINLARIVGD